MSYSLNKLITLSNTNGENRQYTIGRNQQEGINSITINHFSIAKEHAYLFQNSNKFFIQSISDTYITTVNGKSIGQEKFPISEDDELQLGELCYVFTNNTLVRKVPDPGFSIEMSNLCFSRHCSKLKIFSHKPQNKCIILSGLTLSFSRNHLIGITGPSGCGKTTLLRLIGKLEEIQQGIICLNGELLSKKHLKKIAYLPQDDILSPYFTIQETMEHNSKICGLKHNKKVINQIVYELRLDNVIDKKIPLLSGGERKRVSIGIELLKKPKLFLLDEPTSGLDSENAKIILEYLKDFTETGVTVIIITHQKDEFSYLNNLLVLNKKGEKEYCGHPSGYNYK